MPGPYMLDTNAVSDLMTDQANVKAKVAAAPDQVMTSVIVRGEIKYGLERMPKGKRRQELEGKALQVFRSMPCEPVTESVADQYALLRRNQDRD